MKILNFGSLNQDYTYRVPHIVAEGETISSSSLNVYPGGKGLNQSVALRKAGAEVWHAGRIGKDGAALKELCGQMGIHTQFILEGDTRTGNALIQVDDNGKNSIVLYPGANHEISEEMTDHVLGYFGGEDILLLQNEINGIDSIIEKAYRKGMKIVLNPSPYNEKIEKCDLSKIYLLLLNEIEGGQITGAGSPEQILNILLERYPKMKIVLTLGAKGAWYAEQKIRICSPAFKVEAEDTTGAGDTFTGYFVKNFFLSETDAEKALRISAAAAAVAVGRKGAATSIPFSEEVEEFLCERGEQL